MQYQRWHVIVTPERYAAKTFSGWGVGARSQSWVLFGVISVRQSAPFLHLANAIKVRQGLPLIVRVGVNWNTSIK